MDILERTSSKEIELTEIGKRYMQEQATESHQVLKNKYTRLRSRTGMPAWEIKKALCNARGNVQKAEEELRSVHGNS